MKPGTKNMLLLSGAGIVAYILVSGNPEGAGGGGFFGEKSEKSGTVGGGALPAGSGDSWEAPAGPAPVTKKEATNYTPTSFGYVAPQPSQALLDQYYQRNIEQKSEAQKIAEGKVPYTPESGIGYTGLYPDLPRLSSAKPLPIISGGTGSKKTASEAVAELPRLSSQKPAPIVSGGTGSKKSSKSTGGMGRTISPSGQTSSSVMRSISAGIRRGL